MIEGEAIPAPPRLRWLAKASVVLGAASLIRFLPELISIVPKGPSRRYFALVALDLVIGALWLKLGLALRKHARGAIGFASIAGAVIFTHAITSAIVVGPQLVKSLHRSPEKDYFLMLAVTGSRFLIYGVEFLFWPWAFLTLFRLARDPEGDPTPRRSVLLATIASLLISAVIQFMILATIFDR